MVIRDAVAKTVTCTQQHYIDMVQSLDLTTVKHKLDDTLPASLITEFRGTTSAISWVSVTSPIAATIASLHQGCLPSPTFRDATKLNNALAQLKTCYRPLIFRFIQRPWRTLTVSDSSFANVSRHSQGGFLILLQHANPMKLGGEANIFEFKSNKAKRVCTSTMHSEAVSHCTAQENASFIQTFLHEIMNPTLSAQQILALEGPSFTQNIGLVDCEDLHAALVSAAAPNPSNRALTLYLSSLRELKETKFVHEYLWVDTRDMLANAMTKVNEDGTIPLDEIQEFLTTGTVVFRHPYRWCHQLTYD